MTKPQQSKLCFVFPENDNFREQQPELMFTEFYGLIDGYGMMFDPLIIDITDTIPEYINGFPVSPSEGTIYICGSNRIQYQTCDKSNLRGIFIEHGQQRSEKEFLQLDNIETFYPANLCYTTYEDSDIADWSIGGKSVISGNGRSYAMGIEFFNMLERLRDDQPEMRLINLADAFSRILPKTIYPESQTHRISEINKALRLDCQTYGVNRFLLSWFSDISAKPVSFQVADSHYKNAVESILNNKGTAKEYLSRAFQELAVLRYSLCETKLKFIEVPHIGILFEDEGFFEFEWPDFTMRRMEKLMDFADNGSCKVAFEAGGSCWKHFANRYPQTIKRMNQLLDSDKIDVTNGTFSLPYALYSPIGIQYWQFEKGLTEFSNLFPNHQPVYQCQENSFTPLMPQLMTHFDYKAAIHVVQNRGTSPTVNQQFLNWQGADSSCIPVMTIPDEELGRKGCNFFYDLPLVLKKYSDMPIIYYPNFQDIGFIPLRTQIYRANQYATIWGDFITPQAIPFTEDPSVNQRTFKPEEYGLAEAAFYKNPTCINSLSQLERIYDQYNQLCLLQQAAYMCNRSLPDLTEQIQSLLLQEAHDVTACQAQRVGDFYGKNTLQQPPISKRTLQEKTDELNASYNSDLSKLAADFIATGNDNPTLLNTGNCTLPFAKVAFSDNINSDSLITLGKYSYAVGNFKPETVQEPTIVEFSKSQLPLSYGNWTLVHVNNQLQLQYCDHIFSLGIIDKKRGQFEITTTTVQTSDQLARLTINYSFAENNIPIHHVILTILLAPLDPLAEVVVTYTTSTEFDYLDKWSDYLGLVLSKQDTIGSLTHCTPGYSTKAKLSKIVSPYFIQSSTGISLLNSGTPYYERLNKHQLAWVFHNYQEEVNTRRMAIYLGDSNPQLISSCWNRGVIPFTKERVNSIKLPASFQAESFIADNKLLACCLSDTDITSINNIEILGHKEKPTHITAGTLAIFYVNRN